MKPHRCAMSLIEVTIVVLIIGLLATITAPRFADSVRAMQRESAARQLVAHVNYLRHVAINEGRSVALICNNQDHTYSSDSVDSPDQVGELLHVSVAHMYDGSIELDADFDSEATLTFDFEGVPHVGSAPMQSGSISLRSNGLQTVVLIARGTGVARIESDEDAGIESSGAPSL